jgi:DNA-binding beta-propeller fold protein YncE
VLYATQRRVNADQTVDHLLLASRIGPDGRLSAPSPVEGTPTGGRFAGPVAVDPSGRFVYVLNTDSTDISAFEIKADGNGTVVPIGNDLRFPAGDNPRALAVDPSGRFVYVADDATATILKFGIQADGRLGTPVATPLSAGNARLITIDPSGAFMYVPVGGEKGNIRVFEINQETGGLTERPLFLGPDGTAVNSLAIYATVE